MTTAKVGAVIKAYSFENEPKKKLYSDYYIGLVTEVKKGEYDSCEYVYYLATTEVEVNRATGEVESTEPCNREMRLPQNNIPTNTGRTTNYIEVITKE